MKTESAVSDWSKYPNQFRCFLIGTNKKIQISEMSEKLDFVQSGNFSVKLAKKTTQLSGKKKNCKFFFNSQTFPNISFKKYILEKYIL